MNPARILKAAMAALLVAVGAALAAAPAPDIAAKVLALTDAETRIVWLRNKQWQTNKGGVDGGVGCSLMAFDTAGKGERELVPEGEIYNPLISPSGRHVIYTATTDGKRLMHCVDWNGANSRVLGEGYALWAWREPASGREWVYTSDTRAANGNDATFVDRFQVDKPEARERIFTGRLSNRFSLSADGTHAASEFPHPNSGMLYTRTGQVDRKMYHNGCNTYISPDDSYFVTIMDGGHRLVTLYKLDGSSRDVGLIPPGLKPVKDGSKGVVWNPKWASDARHMSVAGPFRNLHADHSDIWLGRFADDFSSIAKWVQVTDNEFMDVFAHTWIDPGLGRYAGEAPYTLAVPASVTGPGDWRWSYGDGADGSEGRHTFGEAGDYAITARQGDRTMKGTVRVAERAAPKLLSAVALDDRRVLITCSEPVQTAVATVTLENGTAATKLSVDSEGTGIIAEFAAPLGARETLAVKGVTDRAQSPNEMPAAQARVVVPDWPSNLAGLCYLWQNSRTRNVVVDERVGLPVATGLGGWLKPAQYNRFGAAVAPGGGFSLCAGSPERIADGIDRTHQFSLEIVVASADLAQTKGADDKPVAIFTWGYSWGNGVFWLFQEKDKLLAGLSKYKGDKQPEVFEMATLPDTKPHHVIVSVAAKRLALHLDGKKVKEIDPSPASLGDGVNPFFLAAHHPDPHKNTWRGTFEHVAMYNRFIEEPEAAKNAAAVAASLAQRKPLPRIEVQATLVAKSKLPDPGQMAPYRNALVVNEYAVEKVLQGTYAPQTIRVAQWGIIDLKATPLAAQPPGARVKLVLERFADHHELESELIADTLEENFDLNLYTDVNL